MNSNDIDFLNKRLKKLKSQLSDQMRKKKSERSQREIRDIHNRIAKVGQWIHDKNSDYEVEQTIEPANKQESITIQLDTIKDLDQYFDTIFRLVNNKNVPDPIVFGKDEVMTELETRFTQKMDEIKSNDLRYYAQHLWPQETYMVKKSDIQSARRIIKGCPIHGEWLIAYESAVNTKEKELAIQSALAEENYIDLDWQVAAILTNHYNRIRRSVRMKTSSVFKQMSRDYENIIFI